ncbi:hypothetical protein ES288_D13G153100v1 [Gossypium darwinii]|uniref:Uncharacterized protein n=1 Tax=Gossypium darwinii TaxID=34276 RepID=A0A5D1ZY81_GOSDA|nr:hypothetical protein ES288_D13G153100v1 [Gossypium darwinii]
MGRCREEANGIGKRYMHQLRFHGFMVFCFSAAEVEWLNKLQNHWRELLYGIRKGVEAPNIAAGKKEVHRNYKNAVN